MAKPEWNRYFSLSLLAHLLILSLGGALLYAHRSLPETPQESIRVHLAGPDGGRGNAGTREKERVPQHSRETGRPMPGPENRTGCWNSCWKPPAGSMTGVKWSARKGTARRNREESRLGSVLLLADPEKLGEAGTWQETDRGTVPAVLVQGMDPEHPRAAGKAWRTGAVMPVWKATAKSIPRPPGLREKKGRPRWGWKSVPEERCCPPGWKAAPAMTVWTGPL